MKNRTIVISILILINIVWSQETGKFSGVVFSQKKYQPIKDAQVIVLGTDDGTITDKQGQFSLILETGIYTVKIQMAGYSSDTIKVNVVFGKNSFREIYLKQKDYEAPGIVKVAHRDKMIQPIGIDIKFNHQMHSLLEMDPVKSLSMQPGVSYINDYNTALFIRGSKSYQSLISYNDIPLLNSSHSGGFFSMFNGASVGKIEFSPAIYSVKRSGYLGGRVNIVPSYQRDDRFNSQIFTGMASSGFHHTSDSSRHNYFISGRRTYIDLFTGALLFLFGKDTKERVPYWFDDFQAGYKYYFNKNSKLEVNGLYSRDHFDYKLGSNNSASWKNPVWGNNVIGVKYNYQRYPFSFQSHIFSSSCINRAKLNYMDVDNLSNYYGGRLDLKYSTGNNSFKTGAGYIAKDYDYHIQISDSTGERNDMQDMIDWFYNYSRDTVIYAEKLHEPYMYLQYSYSPFSYLGINAGANMRYNSLVEGFIFSPRFQLSGNIGRSITLSLTMAKHYQSNYSLQNIVASESDDFITFSTQSVYYLVDNKKDLLSSEYISFGGIFTFSSYMKMKSELYYKNMNNIPQGDSLGVSDLQSFESYGFDLSITGRYKNIKEFNLAYSLGIVNVLAENRTYSADHERLHQLKLNCSYKISNSWTINTRGMYLSGLPYTPRKIIIGAGPSNENTVRNIGFLFDEDYYGSIGMWKASHNSFRLPPYYRLDLGISKKWTHYNHRLTLELFLFNLFITKNPLSYSWESDNHQLEKSTYLNMPIIPSFEVIYEF
jgi:hypothetical protein